MSLQSVKLNDKYDLEEGRVYLTGMQAVIRLMLAQKRADRANGLNTAGFISGYRGSPLGTLDTALWRARSELSAEDIIFHPGVNEELAATAVHGSQQVGYFDGPKFDGVFSAWYGKGPGVDRAGDALKHGNLAGTAKNGGVLVFAGDDHPGKSSTTCHQSEQALAASMIPVLYPSNAEDYLRFGAIGYALSRFSGLWTGFKCVNDTADSTMTARLSRVPHSFVTPEIDLPPEGLNLIVGDTRFAQESRTVDFRLPAAQAFARANGLDERIYDGPKRRIGIICAGKAYLDLMEALSDLQIDQTRAANLGISVLKLGLTWPADPETLREFCSGLQEVLVVEEKRAFIEPQVKDAMYSVSADRRPNVTGKTKPSGEKLLSSWGELSPDQIADALIDRLRDLNISDEALEGSVSQYLERRAKPRSAPVTELARTPFYCAGCPHNTSTKVPEGSVGLAGIGCHVMSAMMPHRKHIWPVQMGGEGVNWTGAAPFVSTEHVYQNIGDGTFYHSGLLAIRSAIASKTNITYKLLYNDAVAMTGGQPVEGQLTVGQIAAELLQEGAKKVAVVADDPDKYQDQPPIPKQVQVHHRDDLDHVQTNLAEVQGVTILIYDQVCAAEKRRRRKRGTYPDPDRRLFINTAVCEGCGDCGAKSNCVSLQPVETEYGRKRRIDQSSCNKDYSCVKGFCPSFVSVLGGKLKKQVSSAPGEIEVPEIADPKWVADTDCTSIMIAGVGGTGVVTIGAVLGMAAHIEGKAASILDMTGLSQKNGAVYSHLRVAETNEQLNAPLIGPARADVLLGCDIVAAATGDSLTSISDGETAMVLNGTVSATSAFTFMPDLDMSSDLMVRRLTKRAASERSALLNASEVSRALLGDTIGANMMMVGAATQLGLLPISVGAIEEAIKLNGVAIDMNLKAFEIGRWIAVDPDAVVELAGLSKPAAEPASVADMIQQRSEDLTAYQNAEYAERYKELVRKAQQAEIDAGVDHTEFSSAVARYAYKVMAYKDEFEVARLYTDGAFRARLENEFEGDFKLQFHMAPPLIAPRDKHTGELKKITLGGWMLPMLGFMAKLRGLRGTPFDPFGWTEERKGERALRDQYFKMIEEICLGLSKDTMKHALTIAKYPEHVRGYGHVKEKHLEEAAKTRDASLSEFRTQVKKPTLVAAE